MRSHAGRDLASCSLHWARLPGAPPFGGAARSMPSAHRAAHCDARGCPARRPELAAVATSSHSPQPPTNPLRCLLPPHRVIVGAPSPRTMALRWSQPSADAGACQPAGTSLNPESAGSCQIREPSAGPVGKEVTSQRSRPSKGAAHRYSWQSTSESWRNPRSVHSKAKVGRT